MNSETIKKYLADENMKKSTYDIKSSLTLLTRNDLEVKGFDFDFKLAAYLLNCDLKDDISNIFGSYGINLPSLKEKDKIEEFSTLVALKISELKDKLILEMKEKEVYELYFDIELPLVHVLF